MTSNGTAFSAGGEKVLFEIYDSFDLTNSVYAEQYSIDIVHGCYKAELGHHPEAGSTYSNIAEALRMCPDSAWLAVSRGGDVIGSPQIIAASPYTLNVRGISVTPSNYVGLGTETPAAQLHLYSDDQSNAFLRVESAHETEWGETGLRLINPANQWKLFVDDYSEDDLPADTLSLYSQSADAHVMTWAANRNVGIGTTNPTSRLTVSGSVQSGGNYYYTTPQTNYLVLNMGDFKDFGYAIYTNQIDAFRVSYLGGIMLIPDDLSWGGGATVRLPHGATIEEMGVLFREGLDGAVSEILLSRKQHTRTDGSGVAHIMATTAYPDTYTTTAITNPVVDNASYNYWIKAMVSGDIQTTFKGVYLRYVTQSLIP
jgi:hypothetical protein